MIAAPFRQPPGATQAFHATRQQIDLGAYSVAVDCYGNIGTPVMLLHGIPGWRGTWAKVAPLLAADQRPASQAGCSRERPAAGPSGRMPARVGQPPA